MTAAIVLFCIAAVGGLVLAVQRFRGAPQPSLPIALVHGAVAAAGLIALIMAVMGGAPGGAKTALIIFLVAAVGGFALFGMHLSKKALPIPVVVIHALVAASALVILLMAAMSH